MNDAWSRWLPVGCAPARATVEARLASAARGMAEVVLQSIMDAERQDIDPGDRFQRRMRPSVSS